MNNPFNDGIIIQTLKSVQFLSRLPVHRISADDEPVDFAKSAYTFPVAGLIIALPGAIALYLAVVAGLDALTAAVIAVAVQILVTGALHEDGLADVADGFWGGNSQERKLEIMRDSAIGTYGTLALILSIALRMSLLASIVPRLGAVHAVAFLVAAEGLSRMAMLCIWVALPAVRSTGSAASKSGKSGDGKSKAGLSIRYGTPDSTSIYWGAVCTLPSFAILLVVGNVFTLLAIVICASAATACVGWLARHHVGGHTGDVLGATQQVSLWGLYLGMALAI